MVALHCTQLTNTPALPQEVINLIIDQVALQRPEAESLATLQACRLVSRSFQDRSRHHILSELKFNVEVDFRKRISKLIKLLKHTKSKDLVPSIRSLKVIVNLPYPVTVGKHNRYPFRNSNNRWNALLDYARNILLRPNTMVEIFDILRHANIQNFTLRSQGRFLDWDEKPTLLESALKIICAGPSIRSLSFINMSRLPESILVEAFFSPHLKDITLRHFIGMSVSHDPPTAHRRGEGRTLAKLKRLEMKRLSYTVLFSMLLLWIGPLSSSSMPSTVVFTHLRVLVVSISSIRLEMETLWKFIRGVSRTLETLELERLNYRIHWLSSHRPPIIDIFRLEELTSLRNLRLKGITYTSPTSNSLDIALCIRVFTNLLSPGLPTGLSSISVELVVQTTWYYHRIPKGPTDIWTTPSNWSVIDETLARQCLQNLRSVSLSALVTFPDRLPDVTECVAQDLKAQPKVLLPKVAASRTVEITVDVQLLARSSLPGPYAYDLYH